MDADTIRRAELHAALGDPTRLAIVDELARSDRAPSELSDRFGLPTNLLAHHVSILERAGLVERSTSSGDRRRRYVRLRVDLLSELAIGTPAPVGRALFVCTHNSARSQLAAELWTSLTGADATSAGTHPADRVHPGAVAAGRRRGLDLSGRRPRRFEPSDLAGAEVVVSVCDRAHEEMDLPPDALHWSIPDPVGVDDPGAFDRAAELLEQRIASFRPERADHPSIPRPTTAEITPSTSPSTSPSTRRTP